jgi:uncharacterized membrane protein
MVAVRAPKVQPRTDVLSVALPRNAEDCYALFCDITRVPEWLRIIRSAVVTEKDRHGRPRRVAFLARLQRATIGYSCRYRVREQDLRVTWATPQHASIKVRGFAQFSGLGERSCLLQYHLDVDLGNHGLPAFDDELFDAHAPSATMSDFRDFAIRMIPS